jgi:GABA(A) receptor-associated protein
MFDNLSNSLFNKKIKTKELPFVEKFSFERRSQQAHNILSKYPDRIPIIVERSMNDLETPLINKNKYLVPKSLTVGQFLFVIRRRLVLPPEKALFIFVNDIIPPTSQLLGIIYDEQKNKDDFLYITYSGENTFG